MKMMLDDMEYTANKGETIMQVARNNGVFIPGLCYHEATGGDNCCRLCLVEVEERGTRRLVAACAYLAQDGMSVVTESEKIARIRKTVLRLLYLEAPDSKVISELMKQYGVVPELRLPQKESGCVLCGLCVKACEVLGASAISTVSRGIGKKVFTPYGRPSDDCFGCSACALICPTGCIEVSETNGLRTIWGKEFEMAICEDCGKPFATVEQYKATMLKVRQEDDAAIICEDCRRQSSVRAFGRFFAKLC